MRHQFCRGCGKPLEVGAQACPHCGAPQRYVKREDASLPPGVAGWSWGAFLLSWVWAIGNRTWIGLLALIPWVGFIVAVVLGVKGREWAWRNREWESVEHFNRVQKQWSLWGVAVLGIVLAVGAAIAVGYVLQSRGNDADAEVWSKRLFEEPAAPSAEGVSSATPPAGAAVTPYVPLEVSADGIGGLLQLRHRGELGGVAIERATARGAINLMESVVPDVGLTGYVHVNAAYRYGDSLVLLVVSTGEYGQSCPATTYAFSYDLREERVASTAVVDGCSEAVAVQTDAQRLIVRKEGAPTEFSGGLLVSLPSQGEGAALATGRNGVAVPRPRDDCDRGYADLLRQVGLTPAPAAVHGPDDADFPDYGCPYRIAPAPGSVVAPGDTVAFRTAWEGS